MSTPVTLFDTTRGDGKPTGTVSNPLVTSQSDGAGGSATPLPPGRAAAAASVPVAPDTVALAGINQTYNRAAAVSATPGNGVLVSGVTTAGTVTFTLTSGSVTINAPLGSSVWPFGATAAAAGTAVGATFTSIFFT